MFTKLCTLGRDSELTYTPNGMAILDLSLAYSYRLKDKKETQWIEGVIFGKQAEALSSYLKKGSRIVANMDDVYIQTYKTKQGEDRFKLCAKVVSIEFAGSANKPETQEEKKPNSINLEDEIPFN